MHPSVPPCCLHSAKENNTAAAFGHDPRLLQDCLRLAFHPLLCHFGSTTAGEKPGIIILADVWGHVLEQLQCSLLELSASSKEERLGA